MDGVFHDPACTQGPGHLNFINQKARPTRARCMERPKSVPRTTTGAAVSCTQLPFMTLTTCFQEHPVANKRMQVTSSATGGPARGGRELSDGDWSSDGDQGSMSFPAKRCVPLLHSPLSLIGYTCVPCELLYKFHQF